MHTTHTQPSQTCRLPLWHTHCTHTTCTLCTIPLVHTLVHTLTVITNKSCICISMPFPYSWKLEKATKMQLPSGDCSFRATSAHALKSRRLIATRQRVWDKTLTAVVRLRFDDESSVLKTTAKEVVLDSAWCRKALSANISPLHAMNFRQAVWSRNRLLTV